MEKLTRLSLVLGLGLMTSLSYGQEEKKKEVAPEKKQIEIKEKQSLYNKQAEPATAPKESSKPADQEKKYEEPKQPVQNSEMKQPAETPQQPIKSAQSEKQKKETETVPVKTTKTPVSNKPVEAAPEKKTPPPPAEQ